VTRFRSTPCGADYESLASSAVNPWTALTRDRRLPSSVFGPALAALYTIGLGLFKRCHRMAPSAGPVHWRKPYPARHLTLSILRLAIAACGWDNTPGVLPIFERNMRGIDVSGIPSAARVTLAVKFAMMDAAQLNSSDTRRPSARGCENRRW
jgi:hypothetical protein